MGGSRSRSCVCGHAIDAHEHYRSGTDCSQCPPRACLKFRSSSGFGARLRRLLPSSSLQQPRPVDDTALAPVLQLQPDPR